MLSKFITISGSMGKRQRVQKRDLSHGSMNDVNQTCGMQNEYSCFYWITRDPCCRQFTPTRNCHPSLLVPFDWPPSSDSLRVTCSPSRRDIGYAIGCSKDEIK